jgi:hypothetical protein
VWRRTIWLITTLAFGLLCAPFAPAAQQPGQVPRIGFVEPSSVAVNGHLMHNLVLSLFINRYEFGYAV